MLSFSKNELCPLAFVNAFEGTPISVGYGYIYVPADLVDTYKAATNWSRYADQIVSLNEYPKTPTGSITDTWEQIFEAEQDGTYSTKYSIGDTKIVDIDGTAVLMQIVAMDSDVLTNDTSKTAPITWVSVGSIEEQKMNTTGATTTGGWANSDLRNYLRETLFPKIEQTVRLNIKKVNKTYKSITPVNSVLTAEDTIWIPSHHEIFGGTTYENDGPVYSSIFDTKANRVKKEGSYGLGSTKPWWLRSADNAFNFRGVNTSGTLYGYNANASSMGVVFGFCT